MSDFALYLPWRPQIADVLDTRFYTLEWLDEQVMAGAVRAWCDEKAIILAGIREYPGGAREVHGMVAAGDLQSIVGLIPYAEAWGLSQGCRVAGIDSREGWSRALAKDGYRVYQVALRKELSSEPV